MSEAALMDKYGIPAELYLLIGVIASVTVIFLVIRGLIPRLTSRVSQRFNFEERLAGNLTQGLRSVLNVSYLIFILDYLATIPQINKYADPVLRYRILDIETLALSLSSLMRGASWFFPASDDNKGA